jgi:hypothetical protein
LDLIGRAWVNPEPRAPEGGRFETAVDARPKLMGNNTPSIYAGHSMPCPYKNYDAAAYRLNTRSALVW